MPPIFNRSKCIYSLQLILCTSIFFGNKSRARPFYRVITERMCQNDSIKIENYLITIINSANDGYDYDIYVEKRLFIHQPTIPAVPGNGGFTTKAAAEKVARKVVEKMQGGKAFPLLPLMK